MIPILDALRCVVCGGAKLDDGPEAVRCRSCKSEFPIVHGIFNSLVKPSEEVLAELRGMAEESGERVDNLQDFMIRRVDHISSFEDRKKIAKQRGEVFDYYGST